MEAAERTLLNYARVYQQLYQRQPADLRVLDDEWVSVKGARMRVSELAYLTLQLQQEYHRGRDQRRNIILRLVQWLKQH